MRKIFLFVACAVLAPIWALNIHSAPEAVRNNPHDKNYVLSYNAAILQAKKSVISILAETKSSGFKEQFDDFFNDPFFRHFFGQARPKSDVEKRFGSGVIISEDGYIITNNHVVGGASKISVNFDGEQYDAKLIGADEKTDIALIKIKAKSLPAIEFANSDELLEGDVVFAIGNPFGVGESVSMGIISALNKSNIGLNAYEDFIQTDAAINPGNSGGALVDSRGALIGINSAIITKSGGANGIGFAIPANMAQDIALQLAGGGKIERGYLGIMMTELEGDLKKTYKHQKGAIISQVTSGSSAQAAGLKRGDLVYKADEKDIKNIADLRNYVGKKRPGESIVLYVERDQKDLKIRATLRSNDESAAPSALGMILQDSAEGAAIASVESGSKADQAGLRKGDIIIAVGDFNIQNAAQFEEAMKKSSAKFVRIWVKRGAYIDAKVLKKEDK